MKVSPELHKKMEEALKQIYDDLIGTPWDKWVDAVLALIPEAEPPEDLVKVAIAAYNATRCQIDDSCCPEAMTAGLRVALNDPRVLGEPSEAEEAVFHTALIELHGYARGGLIRAELVAKAFRSAIRERRSRLLPETKTPEEIEDLLPIPGIPIPSDSHKAIKAALDEEFAAGNAHLIAAAPELYTAAVNALALMNEADTSQMPPTEGARFAAIRWRLEVATKEARGEKP